jgi:hypothetical protein
MEKSRTKKERWSPLEIFAVGMYTMWCPPVVLMTAMQAIQLMNVNSCPN